MLENCKSIGNWENIRTETPDTPIDGFLNRMLIQGKRVSQIIAYIWLYIDSNDEDKRNTAQELDRYFKQGGASLEDLLCAKPESSEFKFLQKVFGQDQLKEAIFDEAERAYYDFYVTVNEFRSAIEDPEVGEKVFKVRMPYPPRPQISDENGLLTRRELEAWIESPSNKGFPSENPFIPTTCS